MAFLPMRADADGGHSTRGALFELTVAKVGEGTVRRVPDRPLYSRDTMVVLYAAANSSWHFTGWSGDTSATNDSLALVMSSDRNITATFELNPYSLQVTTLGPGRVVQHPSLDRYTDQAVVRLIALPDPGFVFASWSGDFEGVDNPLSVVMDGDKHIVANFIYNQSTFRVPPDFDVRIVTNGLDQPVGMAFLPDGRLFVVERESAKIRMIVNGALSAIDPVCVVDSVSSLGGERGLLGIAVDPQWPARPYVYVSYTAVGNSIRLSRFEASGDLSNASSSALLIDRSTRYDVLRNIQDRLEYHNAGCLRFGPDGMLYFTVGDDGDDCAAQDTTRLMGTMMRLDVRSLPRYGGPPPREDLAPADNPFYASSNIDLRLVWAMGFRNPFSFHIDPVDGTAFICDVGLVSYEELDRVSPASPARDMGWPYFEGPDPHLPTCHSKSPEQGYGTPAYSYNRVGWPGAIISGGVYRPIGCPTCDFPSTYNGDYFFSDFYLGFLRRIKVQNGVWSIAPPEYGQPSATDWGRGFDQIASYLEGPDGAIWFCRTSVDFEPGTGSIGRLAHSNALLGADVESTGGLEFAPPYPSPATGQVHFVYTLPAPDRVGLAIYDVGGRRVRELVGTSPQAAGPHHLAWDGRTATGTRAAPGVYLAQLETMGRRFVRRVVIAR